MRFLTGGFPGIWRFVLVGKMQSLAQSAQNGRHGAREVTHNTGRRPPGRKKIS